MTKSLKLGKFFSIIIAIIMACSLLALTACGESETTKTVISIQLTEPTKTDYYVGDTFSLEGGYLTVTYDDGSTEKIALDAEGVEITTPKMDTTGKKSINIKYGGKRAQFSIRVNMLTHKVTLDYNYDGAENGIAEADLDTALQKPADPKRTGYSFQGWFVDQTCTVAYDFAAIVSKPFTLYARWLKTGATVRTFTFDFNRTGVKNPTIALKYEDGAKASKYAVDPERTGYRFDGWFTQAEAGSEYDFTTVLSADTTVYAHWTKTVTGTNEWVFEAENIDLSKMSGPGLSGTVSKGGMLYSVTDKGASGDRYLGNLYKLGSTATFYIDSDIEVSDVKFVARLSMEARDFTFNKENYKIKVNDEELNFGDLAFKNVPAASGNKATILAFKDFEIAANLTLRKGSNKIEFVTNNSSALSGTTITAAAPLIDCIKLTSAAVLSWDGAKNLPMEW